MNGSFTMKRWLPSVVSLFVVPSMMIGAIANSSAALSVDAQKAARVKAAYLLNFARYTQWPDSAFESPGDPIVFTQVGECGVGEQLMELVQRSEPIDGHPLLLQSVTYPEKTGPDHEFLRSLDRSHLIFVCSLPPDRVQFILDHLGGSNVLTVGDIPGFCGNGGMLGFVLHEDRIVFEANPKAIQESPVAVSAKVLKLAQIVGEGGSQ